MHLESFNLNNILAVASFQSFNLIIFLSKTLTNYLFMDSDPKVDKRSQWRSKFTILALSLKNRPVLHCVGLWLFLQQCSNVLALQLCESIVNTYVSLVHDSQENLNNMPNISPVFAVGFMTCLTEFYSSADKWPSTALVEITTHWMEARYLLVNISGICKGVLINKKCMIRSVFT